MTHGDYITALLHDHYQACLLPRRQRRARNHWQDWPALRGRSVDTVARIISDARHPDHNQVAAALIDAHRQRPRPDVEMTLLLAAARPMVLLLDRHDRHGDSRAALWAAVARRLTTSDPAAIAFGPTPFLIQLLGRIRSDAAKRPSEPVPDPHCVHRNDLEGLLAPRVEFDEVATRALARRDLDHLRHDRAWPALERYALHGRASREHPSHIARQRRRLADAIDYHAA